jgi:hypothetical protein
MPKSPPPVRAAALDEWVEVGRRLREIDPKLYDEIWLAVKAAVERAESMEGFVELNKQA